MCGRYAYLTSWSNIHFFTGAHVPLDALPQRYNLPPTQLAPIVRINPEGKKVGELLKWGLVPPWAKDTKHASNCANARSDTIFEKPSFKSAIKKKRCLVAVSGYYEWKVLEGNKKQPYYIYNKDSSLLFLAGIWESWDKVGESLETFSIITTEANSFIQTIHDRMPVILNQKYFDTWLRADTSLHTVTSLLKPLDEDTITAHAVSSIVNKPINDNQKCIEPLESS